MGQWFICDSFVTFGQWFLLQSYVIMSGGRSGQKQRSKEYVKFLALKVVVVALNIWEVVAYGRVFKTVFDWETKRNFYKVVAHEEWSQWESWLHVCLTKRQANYQLLSSSVKNTFLITIL